MKKSVMIPSRLFGFITLLVFCMMSLPVSAQQDVAVPPPASEFAQLKLIRGPMTPGAPSESPAVTLGVDVTLAKGWKVYWRSPGDAGQPITLDWKDSVNVSDVKILWPAPTRYVEEWGLEVFGYKDHVVFPLVVTRDDPAKPSSLKLLLHYSVCSDICVPYDQTLEMEIPTEWDAPADEVAAIEEFQSQTPRANGAYGFLIKDAIREEESAERGILRVTVESSRRRFIAPDVFVETDPGFRFPKAKLRLTQSNRHAEFTIPYEITLPGNSLANRTLSLTLTDANRAVETNLVVPVAYAQSEEGSEPPADTTPLAWFLLIAFIGGMLLNFMPCVLPVLSIKLMGIITQGGRERAAMRWSFFATTCGIIASFLLLAGVAIAAREAGQAVGWGFHFQQPLFLITLSLVMVLFAAKMWELYEMRLPHWLQSRLAGGPDSGLLADFSHGAFATLLATPCSAPILGTAIGFALSRGPQEIVMIFFMLGLGLSVPYLLGILFPSLAKILPRPGPWMLRLKQVMGFFLLTTALWLISIVARQAGMNVAWISLGACAAILIVLWLGKRWPGRLRIALVLALAAVALFAPATGIRPEGPVAISASQANVWNAFEPERISDLVQDGKVVVVDVTADWCLTCMANDLLVWRKQEIHDALTAEGVVAMRADWTSPNPKINEYLAGFGRYGIPFAVVYGPGIPEGRALPELLTTKLVLEAIEAAKTPAGCTPDQTSC